MDDLTFLSDLKKETLEKAGAFDCDILVASNHADEDNIKIANMAKDEGVERVIARLSEVKGDTLAEFKEKGIEIFSFTNVHAALMRAMIESPTVYRIMTDTKNVLYSVKVKNTAYTGRQLMDLEFIDQITISRILRGNNWLIPHGNTVIEPGDVLVFSGAFRDADRVRDWLSRE